MKAAYDTYESDVNAGSFEDISEIKLNAAVAEAKTTLEVTVAELDIKKEALAALVMLGFVKAQANKVLDKIMAGGGVTSVEELIKQALKQL